MNISQNAINLITLAFLIVVFIILTNIFYKFKQIKVIKNSKDMTKEEMQAKIEQLEVVKKVSKISESKIESLIRLSGNPLNLSPAIFTAIIYIVPVLLVILGLWFLLIGKKELLYFCLGIAVLSFWYPQYHYKEAVKRRTNAWFKVQQHLYKLQEELEANDYKKSLLNVAMYLKSIGEDEISNGFTYMVEKWPKNEDQIQFAIMEFEYYYPFEIAKDLFSLLINAEASGISATGRLEAFKKTCIMKYDKFANGVLASIPAIATLLSLPFLMLSCVVALLVPNVLDLFKYF